MRWGVPRLKQAMKNEKSIIISVLLFFFPAVIAAAGCVKSVPVRYAVVLQEPVDTQEQDCSSICYKVRQPGMSYKVDSCEFVAIHAVEEEEGGAADPGKPRFSTAVICNGKNIYVH